MVPAAVVEPGGIEPIIPKLVAKLWKINAVMSTMIKALLVRGFLPDAENGFPYEAIEVVLINP